MMRSWWAAILLAATGWAALGGAASAQPGPPVFQAAACPALPPAVAASVQCGTVAVPRDYGAPDKGSFRLAVVVIHGGPRPVPPDPVLYISGGPGSPLTVFAGAQALHPLAPGRDIVLVDQRGTGRSEPKLCPGLDARFIDAVAAIAMDGGTAAKARRQALYAACHQQAVAQGIDLRDFGTAATVEDYEQVRTALGVARWNVFGVSYGTTVAMTLMARHPAAIRSAVLDSLNPPDPILPPWSANEADARAAFFQACDQDAACAAAYPELAGLYADTVHRLARSPLPLPDSVAHGPLTASLFELVIGDLLYYTENYPALPRLIASVHDGSALPFAAAMARLLEEARSPATGPNYPANAAVECRDRPHAVPPMPADADIFDRIGRAGLCDAWVAQGPPPVIPTDTPIPTFVLAGQFDPNARPDVSRQVATMLGPHATWVEFPLVGHSARAHSGCAASLVAAFIARPDQPLDATCAAHPEPIRFLPRAG